MARTSGRARRVQGVGAPARRNGVSLGSGCRRLRSRAAGVGPALPWVVELARLFPALMPELSPCAPMKPRPLERLIVTSPRCTVPFDRMGPWRCGSVPGRGRAADADEAVLDLARACAETARPSSGALQAVLPAMPSRRAGHRRPSRGGQPGRRDRRGRSSIGRKASSPVPRARETFIRRAVASHLRFDGRRRWRHAVGRSVGAAVPTVELPTSARRTSWSICSPRRSRPSRSRGGSNGGARHPVHRVDRLRSGRHRRHCASATVASRWQWHPQRRAGPRRRRRRAADACGQRRRVSELRSIRLRPS